LLAYLAKLDHALGATRACASDARVRARTLLSRAATYYECGQLANGRVDVATALEHAREPALEGLGRFLLGQLDYYDYRTALAHYEAALPLLRDAGDAYHEALTLTNIAELHHDAGRLDEARQWKERALEVSRTSGESRLEGKVLG